MNYISVDPGDRLYKLFDVTQCNDQFQWVFISEYRLTRIIDGVDQFDPKIVQRLTKDRSSRLVISSILEIIGPEYAVRARTLFEELNINLNQIHFVVVTELQRQMILESVPEFQVSVFNYWEHLTPYVTGSWNQRSITPLPKKKFLYLNRRCSPDRAYIFYQLWNHSDFREHAHASMHRGVYWDRNVDAEQHFQQCMAGLAHLKKFKKILKFYNSTELPRLNHTAEAYDYDFFGDRDNDLASYYKNTDISIVVESHPHHPQRAFMPTEKLYRSIAAGQPFIAFGVQNYYRNLAAQGYRFPEIPKYDSIEDIYTRADEFVKYVIGCLNNWEKYLTRQQGYAQHNLSVLKKRTQNFAKLFHPELQQHLKPKPGRT